MLGGTGWLGEAVVRTAIERGHDVTCVARRSSAPDGAAVLVADRDLDDALRPLTDSRWDVVVDVATQPGHVRRAVRDLEPIADRYVYVSSCSAYSSLSVPGIDEGAPVHPPLVEDVMTTWEDYGSAKSACERAVQEGFGDGRSVIVRPALIGGPGDASGRTSYWPLRFARPSTPAGEVLVPDAPELPASIIDVRDLAAWIVRLAERSSGGVFNAVGDPVPLSVHLATAAEVADHRGALTPADEHWLISQGVSQWAGPQSLPLWVADDDVLGIGALSNALARAHGLTLRPLTETLRDTLEWAQREGVPTATRAGLSDEDERRLLAALAG